MANQPKTIQSDKVALWRNPDARAIFYQIFIISMVVTAGITIVRNTLFNLEQRGISSGFSFLKNEAGFAVSEFVPVPQLQGGFLYLLYAIVGGVIAAILLNKMAARWPHTVKSDTVVAVVSVGLIVVLPVLVLYFTGHSIVSIDYTEEQSYGIGLLVGLLNTLKVAALGWVLATILGLIIGIARLSSNWLVARVAVIYIETLRNIPLLLQLFFWYQGVLGAMPGPKDSLNVWGFLVLNNRGVYLPRPEPLVNAGLFGLLVVAALIIVFFWARYTRLRQDRTGEQLPVLYPSLAVLIGLPGIFWLMTGTPFSLEYPVLEGFNYTGGMVMTPEYTALLIGLTMYTAAFIAEIVRSGIQAISTGQREAALAVGLKSGWVMRLVILPQALRVMIPPMTSQYLNLIKNSSLGVAIAYPDLVHVGGTILNQSGQAIEIIAVFMGVYLSFSLTISLFMNWYNTKVRLVER